VTANDNIKLWDVNQEKVLKTYGESKHPIYAMSWCGSMLDSGERGKDGGRIMRRDINIPNIEEERQFKHKSDACSLRWNRAYTNQVSGSMNGDILIWDKYSMLPLRSLRSHSGAVKATAWLPHHDDLLVTGDCSNEGRSKV
jgi:WD40 repeat protein